VKLRKGTTRRRFLSLAATAAASTVAPRASFGLLASPENPDYKDQSFLNLTNSPFAKLHPVPVRAVTIEDGFWSKRRQTNVESSIPSMHDELLAHGRMDNFLRLKGQSPEPQKGPVYSDSDIYKWTEAVGFALQSNPIQSSARPPTP